MELIVTTREELTQIVQTAITEAMSQSPKQGPAPQGEVIDRKELCKRLKISEPTAIAWEKKKKIPSFKIGSAVRYRWDKVLERLEKK